MSHHRTWPADQEVDEDAHREEKNHSIARNICLPESLHAYLDDSTTTSEFEALESQAQHEHVDREFDSNPAFRRVYGRPLGGPMKALNNAL